MIDVTDVRERPDAELFGPVLQVVGEDLQRVDGQHLTELVVGEPEALHELGGRRVHGRHANRRVSS